MLEFINKYKWWIIIIVVAIIVIVVIYKNRAPKKAVVPPNELDWAVTGATASGGGGGLSGAKCLAQSSFPLKKGSTGKQVGALQKFINAVPSNPNKITVDCDFGNQTENAIFAGLGIKEVNLGMYKMYDVYKFES